MGVQHVHVVAGAFGRQAQRRRPAACGPAGGRVALLVVVAAAAAAAGPRAAPGVLCCVPGAEGPDEHGDGLRSCAGTAQAQCEPEEVACCARWGGARRRCGQPPPRPPSLRLGRMFGRVLVALSALGTRMWSRVHSASRRSAGGQRRVGPPGVGWRGWWWLFWLPLRLNRERDPACYGASQVR